MNTDFRLSIDFWQHPKTKKLIRRAGLEGVRSLQILWAWAAVCRSSGSLEGLDEEDIELAADWQGEMGQLVSVLTELRWIDKTENGYALHDWQSHNPWAADAEARGDKARLSRLRQVNPAAYDRCVAEGKTAVTQQEYDALKNYSGDAMANSGDRQRTAGEPPAQGMENASVPPAPSPSPSPKPIKDIKHPLSPSEGGMREPYSDDFNEFWNSYPKKTGKDAAWRAWCTKRREKRLPSVGELITKLDEFRETEEWQKEGGRFIPNPATWINQARWMDELTEGGLTAAEKERILESMRRANRAYRQNI